MPTIVNQEGFRVTIFYNDHPPAHAHVLKEGKKARVYLDPVSLWDTNMRPADAKRAVEIVAESRDTLLEKWREIHGNGEDDNGEPTE